MAKPSAVRLKLSWVATQLMRRNVAAGIFYVGTAIIWAIVGITLKELLVAIGIPLLCLLCAAFCFYGAAKGW